MHRFCDILANTCFVKSPVSPADALYYKNILNLDALSESHLPLICGKTKKKPAGWLSDSYCTAKTFRRQFDL